MPVLPTIQSLQEALSSNTTSSVQLTQAALDRIADPNGEGSRAFTRVYAEQALQAAQASDVLRKAGLARSPLEGLPVSVKDLFDVTGDRTLAGYVVLKDQPPAQRNAPLGSAKQTHFWRIIVRRGRGCRRSDVGVFAGHRHRRFHPYSRCLLRHNGFQANGSPHPVRRCRSTSCCTCGSGVKIAATNWRCSSKSGFDSAICRSLSGR